MRKFKPGQRVLVEHLTPSDGIPMRHLGTVVTILSNEGNRAEKWPYRIIEDKRWVWREDHFTDTKQIVDPNIIFKLSKNTNL